MIHFLSNNEQIYVVSGEEREGSTFKHGKKMERGGGGGGLIEQNTCYIAQRSEFESSEPKIKDRYSNTCHNASAPGEMAGGDRDSRIPGSSKAT